VLGGAAACRGEPVPSVSFCTGKDFSGAYTAAIERFNRAYRGRLQARLIEFSTSTNQQRAQAIQRLETGSTECDVLQVDATWIAEFVQQGWLLDVTQYVRTRAASFIPSTLAPYRYDGRYWAVPQFTGVGLLYRRTDQVARPPATWQEVYRQAAAHGGLAYQGAAYEGLTVNFLELAYAAGGRVLSADGRRAELDSAANLRALELMVDALERGAVPRVVTTHAEEETRLTFEAGNVTFMRNWPYAYVLGSRSPRVRGAFDVSPLPAFEGGRRTGVLGGNGPAISAFSDNPRGAMLLVDHLTAPAGLELNMAVYGLPSPLSATYESPWVRKAVPFADVLEQAVEQAQSRPSSPVYPEITQAIHDNVNAALAGRQTAKEALERAQAQIETALSRF